MEKFTIPQIVEERICVAPMTREQFEIFKPKVAEFLKIDREKYDISYFEKAFYFININPLRVNFSSVDYTKHFLVKASRTITFSQIDFEEKKVENPNDLIGRKCKGFRFDADKTRINFTKTMTDYIGLIGVIDKYYEVDNAYSVEFFDKKLWAYPAELIHLHLVEEETPKEETITLKDTGTFTEPKEESFEKYLEKSIKNSKLNEELDLTKVLVVGETYYSPIFGNIKYDGFSEFGNRLVFEEKMFLFKNGKYLDFEGAEIMIFPSKEVRTWENYSHFKKGEVCLFYTNENYKVVTQFFSKEIDGYWCGKFENGNFVKSQRFDFCEKYDPSKINF